MRRPIICLMVFWVLTAGCETQRAPSGKPHPTPAPVDSIPSQISAIPDVLTVPPETMRTALAEAYRLRPDRRFLLAVSEIHHLLTGQPRGTATAEFGGTQWQVRYRDMDVGALPAFPTFLDLMGLLPDWIRRVVAESPQRLASAGSAAISREFEGRIDRLATPELLGALRQVDGIWNSGMRDPALFPPATRALVLLTLQTLDRVEMGDAVPAKALALLALAKTLTTHDTAREESLLARLMGYTTHAKTVAASLPPSDAVRQYLAGDSESLKAVALAEGATVEARYLWLLRLAERRDEKAFYSYRQAAFPHPAFVLPGLKAGLDLNRFASNDSLSSAVPGVILGELARELGKPVESWREAIARKVPRVILGGLFLADNLIRRALGLDEERPSAFVLKIAERVSRLLGWVLDSRLSSLMDRFESDVQTAGERNLGPFLDPQTYRAYYRSFFYSGMYIRGLHYLDALSSIEAVKQYSNQLDGASRGAAADFSRWYRHLAEFKAGNADPRILLDDLGALSHLGPPALKRSFNELEKRVTVGDPMGFTAAKRMAARMDTRVEHRLSLSNIAYKALRDLGLFESLYRSALATAPLGRQAIWYANFAGNTKLLTELLRSPDVNPEARVEILGHLEKQDGVKAEFLRAEYRRLIDERPESWRVRSNYVAYLERLKDYRGARWVIDEWLEAHDESAGFDYIFARTALARVYEREGQYEAGWEAIEPVVGSWQGGAMERAARLLDKLGRPDEAEEMGRRVVSRYPDSARIRTTLAELYWRHGKSGEAANVLTSMPHRLTTSDWMYVVAPRFAETFKDRPKDAPSAFAALLTKEVTHTDLQAFASLFAKAGKHEVAFQLVSQLRWHRVGEMEILTDAYRYLKAWRGREVALDWLRKSVPVERLNAFSTVIFWAGEYELLWDLFEKPEQGAGADLVWLMRAAASARLGPGRDPRRDALLRYYGNPGGQYPQAIGRFLLRLTTEREVLGLAANARQRCEIAYYVGLRAQAEGRYVDASDWFRVAIETGQEMTAEYSWAYNTLTRWEGEGKSLSRLAAEKL